MLDLGAPRDWLYHGEQDGNDRARDRYQGVVDALQEAGVPPENLQVVTTSYAIANGASAFERLLASGRPTAVMCGNDVLAAGALMKARELGLRVPEDISITGFDDIELAQIVTPGLTTVHVPHRDMGQRCAELLIALRNGETGIASQELAAEIKWRESLGPAPG